MCVGRQQVTVLDIQRFEMITHHAEQEVKRLDAIIKAITIINPLQVKHLRKVGTTIVYCHLIVILLSSYCYLLFFC